MAKKLWVGLGIGCGTLIVIAIVAVVGVGYWAKTKLGAVAEMGPKIKAQQAELAALDKKYAFTPPADGTLVLTEPRLQDYLAVRTGAAAAFQTFEAQADALKAKKHAGFSEGMEAAGKLFTLGMDIEHQYIVGLDAHHMSPAEFHAITDQVSTEPDDKSPNAALLAKYKAQIDQTRNPGLDGLLETGDVGATIKQSVSK